MEEKIKLLQNQMTEELKQVTNSKTFFELQTKYLGKNGEITGLLRELGKASKEVRPILGKMTNALKIWAENEFAFEQKKISRKELEQRYENEKIDITLPSQKQKVGTLHPLTIIKNELVDVLTGLGFSMYDSPEIEKGVKVFSVRDFQNTLFVNDEMQLKTNLATGLIKSIEQKKLPLKVFMAGKAFNKNINTPNNAMFHKMEGLIIDKNLSMCDVYGILHNLAKELLGEKTKTRLRPTFFDFTKPSVQIDVQCSHCGGTGCNFCQNAGWIKILSGGMLQPTALQNGGIDSEIYKGIAFAVEIEKIAMLKYDIPNIDLFFENDIRFLKQFK